MDIVLDDQTGDLLEKPPKTTICEEYVLDESTGEFVNKHFVVSLVPKNLVETKEPQRKKRKAIPETWHINLRKKARLSGQSYYDSCGTIKPMKIMSPPCPKSCQFRCSERVSESVRQDFFNKYHCLESTQQKWEFILRFTRTDNVQKIKLNAKVRRHCSRKFFIATGLQTYPSEEFVKVCKTMFLNTLSISDSVIRKAFEKITNKNGVLNDDLRGNLIRTVSELKQKQCELVHKHINSFPTVDSHYCREKNTKKYLNNELSVAKMYKLYEDFVSDPVLKVSERAYRDIFNVDFDLHFHTLKKDACDTCSQYQYASQVQKQNLESKFLFHLSQKDAARALKNQYKEESLKSKGESICAIFDYQKGITLPRAEASSFYYKRKLTVHNFTIFDTRSKQAFNFMYDESVTGSGPNEVSSALYNFILSNVKLGVKKFIFVSDNCPGQNRNKFLYAFYAYCAAKLNIQIQHLFLVTGHTQSEVDNVHSVIERSLKKKTVFAPDQLYEIVQNSSKNHAYRVIKLGFKDILDFKNLVSSKTFSKAADKKPLKISNVCELRVDGKNPFTFQYKYQYDSEWSSMTLIGMENNVLLEPKQLRNKPKGITRAKKQDLITLCKSGLIKSEFVNFYNCLPEDTEITDENNQNQLNSQ
uniref:CSON004503 protein n=1 Tax=Culicoides sonorensis TaxID=179676 RepID=A0A336L7N8_CULSO